MLRHRFRIKTGSYQYHENRDSHDKGRRLCSLTRDIVTHICGDKLTSIGSKTSLAPGRHQAIVRTNIGIMLIGPLGTNFSEILIEIQTFVGHFVSASMCLILTRIDIHPPYPP